MFWSYGPYGTRGIVTSTIAIIMYRDVVFLAFLVMISTEATCRSRLSVS